MQPKTISTLLLLIGIVGSAISMISCKSSTVDYNKILNYCYVNTTNQQIEIKVYKDKATYNIHLSNGEEYTQTVIRGMHEITHPEGSIIESDSICISFTAQNRELWYIGPWQTTTDKSGTSPYILENYTKKKESEHKTRCSYSFTQKHVDLATPRP